MLDSHYLSYLLRHHPEDKGLKLDEYGWCEVDKLTAALNITKRELEDCVNNNTRYVFSEDKRFIKAAHGHSIPIKYTNAMIPPEILYHGTALKSLTAIRKEGLKKMNREAVHLSEDREAAFRVGSRHANGDERKTIVLEIRAKSMYFAGFKFYKSEDNVWLVESVPPEYIN